MKTLFLVLALFCFEATLSSLYTDNEVIISRKYDNLPWPLLNPHAVDFLVTPGLHCYYASVEAVNIPQLNWIERLHLQHCYEEISGVFDFFNNHQGYSVPEILCPQITGIGKMWHDMVEQHGIDYFNSSAYHITIQELLSKDPEFGRVYNNKGGHGKLYSNYNDVAPADDKLYSNYNDAAAMEIIAKTSVIKNRKAMYVSQQDIEVRMLAGFNYGLIIAKDLTRATMSAEEVSYVKETEKTENEWAWTSSSFYCTFYSNTQAQLRSIMETIEKKIEL